MIFAALAPLATRRAVSAGEVLFREGAPADASVFLVEAGTVRLSRGEHLTETLSEGAVFGLRAHLTGAARSATATAASDGVLLELPYTAVEEAAAADPALALALAGGFAAELPARVSAISSALRSGAAGLSGPVEDSRPPLTSPPGGTVRAAAEAMTARKVGSVVVTDPSGRPLGVVTDAELRGRIVAAGRDPAAVAVHEIMRPPHAVRERRSAGALLAEMAVQQTRHLCVTEDGTADSPLLGVISEHDLARRQGGTPGRLIRAVRRAPGAASLRDIRDEADQMLLDVAVADVEAAGHIAAALEDAIVQRAIGLAEADVGAVSAPWCWVSLGSGGRRERLLRTDQDNALVYADAASPAEVQRLAEIAARVVGVLEAVGLERCPGDIMATNPACRGSVSEWRARFQGWVVRADPKTLMEAATFFDLRAAAGDPALVSGLKLHIGQLVGAHHRFLPYLAREVFAAPPPLGLLRGIIAERDGRFDLKGRGTRAIIAAARVLALDVGDRSSGTLDRLRAVGAAEPGLADLCAAAQAAMRLLLRHRARSGRYLALGSLDRFGRKALRDALTIVEDVRGALRSRYRLDLLG